MPAAAAQRPGLAALPAGARRGVRELRLLGHGPAARRAARTATTTGWSRTRSPRSAATSGCTRRRSTPEEQFWAQLQRPGLRRAQARGTTAAAGWSACTRSACAGSERAAEGMAGHGAGRGVREGGGPGCPGGVRGLRREPAGAAGRPGADHRALPGRGVLPGPGAGRARPGPRLRVRAPRRRRATCTTALSRLVQAQQVHIDLAERLRLLQDLGGPRLLLPRMPPPPQEVRVNRRWLAGRLHSKKRDASGDLAPLRRVQHVLRVGARPVDGLHLRLLPERGRHAGGGPGRQARPGRPQARPAPGHAAARRRLRLGRHGPARGPGVRRQGARRDPVRAAGGVGAEGDRGGGPGRAGRGPPPGLPRRARGRVRRGQLDRPDRAHRPGPAARLLLLPVRQAAARAAGC